MYLTFLGNNLTPVAFIKLPHWNISAYSFADGFDKLIKSTSIHLSHLLEYSTFGPWKLLTQLQLISISTWFFLIRFCAVLQFICVDNHKALSLYLFPITLVDWNTQTPLEWQCSSKNKFCCSHIWSCDRTILLFVNIFTYFKWEQMCLM